MTNEEAKAYFAMRLKDKYKYANGRYTRQREAFEMAIEALEKQIPKKPKDTDWIYCPYCGKSFGLWGEENFCKDCGQHIDWSEE